MNSIILNIPAEVIVGVLALAIGVAAFVRINRWLAGVADRVGARARYNKTEKARRVKRLASLEDD